MALECLECGEALIGRADKKFCDDQCRVSYHNKLKAPANNYMRNVNNVLKKNRRILLELNPNGKTRIHKDKLNNKGFNFNYFTHVYKTKTGNEYHFIYEQGYLKLENDYYALVVRQDYMDN